MPATSVSSAGAEKTSSSAPKIRKPVGPVKLDISHSLLYPIVSNSALSLGWALVNGVEQPTARDTSEKASPERDDWNIAWHDQSISCKFLCNLQSHQHINHFPGIIELNRKVRMARRLRKMRERFPDDYDFAPEAWCLPMEETAVRTHISALQSDHSSGDPESASKEQIFIIKPDKGSQAKGIFLYSSRQPLPPSFAASGEEVWQRALFIFLSSVRLLFFCG